MKKLIVRATSPDTPVPMEGVRGRTIGTGPVTVHATPYYKKQIADGDLVIVSSAASENS